jgi:hypothetical protein
MVAVSPMKSQYDHVLKMDVPVCRVNWNTRSLPSPQLIFGGSPQHRAQSAFSAFAAASPTAR